MNKYTYKIIILSIVLNLSIESFSAKPHHPIKAKTRSTKLKSQKKLPIKSDPLKFSAGVVASYPSLFGIEFTAIYKQDFRLRLVYAPNSTLPVTHKEDRAEIAALNLSESMRGSIYYKEKDIPIDATFGPTIGLDFSWSYWPSIPFTVGFMYRQLEFVGQEELPLRLELKISDIVDDDIDLKSSVLPHIKAKLNQFSIRMGTNHIFEFPYGIYVNLFGGFWFPIHETIEPSSFIKVASKISYDSPEGTINVSELAQANIGKREEKMDESVTSKLLDTANLLPVYFGLSVGYQF